MQKELNTGLRNNQPTTRLVASATSRVMRTGSLAAIMLLGTFLIGCNESISGGPFDSAVAAQTDAPTSDPVPAPAPEPSPTEANRDIYVAWNAHSDSSVAGYQVTYGPTTDTATLVVTDLPVSSIPTSQLSAKVISVQYKSWDDFLLHAGDQICFRIRAYNADGISDYSSGTCKTV